MKIPAPQSGNAKYQQLLELIVDNIRRGIYPDGSMLPSEATLAETAQVSRVTVREAMKILLERNIIVKQQGRRSIVNAAALSGTVKPLRFAWISRDPQDLIMPVYWEIYTALQKCAISINANLIFIQMLNPADEEWLLSVIDSFDGFFLAGVRSSTMLQPLARRLQELPNVIELDDISDSPAGWTVCTDNYLAGKLAAEYLAGCGRTNVVAFIGDLNNLYMGFYDRMRGVVDGFAAQKLPLVYQYYKCSDSVQQLADPCRKLLEQNPQIDTIWAITDDDALKIRSTLEEVSGRQPGYFYSIGIDGNEKKLSDQFYHASLKHPTVDIAQTAFQTMLNLLSGNVPKKAKQLLRPELLPWKLPVK